MDIREPYLRLTRSFTSQKEQVLRESLGILPSTEVFTFKETPHDWAIEQIKDFQAKQGISQVEVISVNDVVFCFAPIKLEPDFEQQYLGYKLKMTQPYAVFRKPL